MDCPTCGTPNPPGVTSCQARGDTLMMTAVGTPPTNNLAIFSLVASVVGWVTIPVVGHIAGIVLGHMARHEIARSGGAQGGDGVALAGLAFSVLSILGVMAFLGLGIGCGLCALLSTEGGFDSVALLRLL